MPTPTDPPSTPHAVPGNSRPNMFGSGFSESDGINEIIDNVENAWTKLGTGASTPTANTVLRGNGTGTTAYGQIVSADITDGTIQAGDIAPGTVTLLKLGEQVLSGTTASVTFSGIPATYRHLVVEILARGDNATNSTPLVVRFNGDATSVYEWQQAYIGSTAWAGSESTGANLIQCGLIPAASATANRACEMTLRLQHYANTSFHKTLGSNWSVSLASSSGNMLAGLNGGIWKNTAAISSISILPAAGNFVAGSAFTLYGKPS